MEPRYKRLHDLREDRDLTQKALAEKLGLHPVQYNRYETGARELPITVLVQLARFYNVSADYLLELSDEPRPLRREGDAPRE